MFKKGLTTALLYIAIVSVFLPLAARAYTFTNQLDYGDRGADVSALQQVLKDLSFFTYPDITGFFGSVTQTAVQAFQSAKSIVSSGTPETTGYGRVGPATLAALNGENSTSAASTTVSTTLFFRDLQLHDTGEDVRALQNFLNAHGFLVATTGAGSPGNETDYFGPATFAALAAFQTANGIEPPAGFFGPQTRIKVTTLSAPKDLAADAIAPPDAPASLKIDRSRSYEVVLSWNAVDNTTSYIIKRKQSDMIDYIVVGTATTTSYTDTTVSSRTGYSYIVTASNAGGESNPSSIVGVYTSSPGGGGGGSPTPAPADTTAPNISSVTATGVSTSTENITWTTDESATSRVAYGATASYGSYSALDSSLVTSHSVSLTDLTASTTYHYAVVSTDSSGNTATSSDETFSTSVYDYFVDSVNGDDSNTGLTSALALRTISDLETKGMFDGARIGLAKGSTWREMLDIDNDNVTIEAYGSGNKPLFDASDEISSGAWSKTDGQTNVYEASLPIDVTTSNGGARYMGVWIDDTRLVQASSLANADSTPGSYYVSSLASSPVTLYVHATDSSVPSADGKTYEYTNRAHGLDTYDATGVTIRGIHGRRNFDSYGSIVVGRSGSAYDIQVSEGNTHNILVRANTYVEDLVADEAYANVGSEIPFVYYENTPPANSTVTCVDCSVTRTSGSGTAFYGHTGGGSTFKTFTLTNPTVSQANSSIGFNSANTDNFTVTNATVSNGSTAVKSGAASTTINTLAFTPTVAGQAVIQTDTASTTWNITDVTVTTGSINTGAFFQASHASTTATITGTNYSSDTGKGHIYGIRSTQAGFQLTSTQNSWRANSGGICYSFSNGTNLSYSSDYNNFVTQCTFSIAGSNYSTVADYKTGTGQDANSTGP